MWYFGLTKVLKIQQSKNHISPILFIHSTYFGFCFCSIKASVLCCISGHYCDLLEWEESDPIALSALAFPRQTVQKNLKKQHTKKIWAGHSVFRWVHGSWHVVKVKDDTGFCISIPKIFQSSVPNIWAGEEKQELQKGLILSHIINAALEQLDWYDLKCQEWCITDQNFNSLSLWLNIPPLSVHIKGRNTVN